jgi:thermostable 8-oxoguanine DNA glycosylase
MNEKEIAENQVIPYLEKLGWPRQLITQYGKVPVKMGTEVKWADIVSLFVDENDSAIPYLVVEVKKELDRLGEILAQTDSYSKFLDTLYFAVTDGVTYLFYQRRSTGGYIKIGSVPIPDKEHLTATQSTRFKPGFILCAKPETVGDKEINQYKDLSDRIDAYFSLIAENRYYLGRSKHYSLRRDITGHYRSIKWIQSLIHNDIDSVKPAEFKSDFEISIMCYRPPNLNRIYAEVENNFDKIKSFLRFIKDFKGEPEENLNKLFDPRNEIHISGMGPFILSQFLAGAHPRDYTIVEDRMVDTMKTLNLIDTKVKSDTAKGYLYINEICKKLYNEIFRKKIEENQNKLGFKIDQDFSLIVIHEFFWEYEEFRSYDVTKLEEASGEKRESEEAETNWNLVAIADFIQKKS